MKGQNFLEEDWDYAIIFDAARYDVFSQLYDDYFEGELEKRKSRASATPEWAAKVFEGRHRMNYFSTNPFINSIGMSLRQVGDVNYDVVPADHITNIIDLWDVAWDDEIGTVRPEDVNRQFRKRRDDLDGARTVIHYMQPHVPFLGRGKGRLNAHLKKSFSKLKTNGGTNGVISDQIAEVMPDIISRMEDMELFMKLGLYSSLDKRSLLQVVSGESTEKLMEFHRENQRKVMEEAKKLVEDLEGDVIITSDHGDAFGEQGVWGHHIEKHIPPLVEVPWLEVEGVN
ncbi:MAG: hypothetical protein ABEJ56_02405 [Candidatus Nanohaloarchaea archaeon]